MPAKRRAASQGRWLVVDRGPAPGTIAPAIIYDAAGVPVARMDPLTRKRTALTHGRISR